MKERGGWLVPYKCQWITPVGHKAMRTPSSNGITLQRIRNKRNQKLKLSGWTRTLYWSKYRACQTMTVLTCYPCLLWARLVHVTLLSPAYSHGSGQTVMTQITQQAHIPIIPPHSFNTSIKPMISFCKSSLHLENYHGWHRVETNSRCRKPTQTPTGITCVTSTRISCTCSMYRSPGSTHSWSYKLFAGWCSLQELLQSLLYWLVAFVPYFIS